MRGSDEQTGSLFSKVYLEKRVLVRHPQRRIKVVVDSAPVSIDAGVEVLYTGEGRPARAPEALGSRRCSSKLMRIDVVIVSPLID